MSATPHLDNLRVSLARVWIPPHVRVKDGKRQNVDGYFRDLKPGEAMPRGAQRVRGPEQPGQRQGPPSPRSTFGPGRTGPATPEPPKRRLGPPSPRSTFGESRQDPAPSATRAKAEVDTTALYGGLRDWTKSSVKLRAAVEAELRGDPIAADQKDIRAKAAAMLQTLREADNNPVPLYRGSDLTDEVMSAWSENRSEAQFWADQNGGTVQELPANSAPAIKVKDYLFGYSSSEEEEEWIVLREPPTPAFQRTDDPRASMKALADSWRAKGVSLDVTVSSSAPTATLSLIRTDEDKRGKGLGEAAMRDLLAWADAEGVTLGASASADFGSNKKQLEAWYKSLGFASNTGSGRDLRISETLVREPAGGEREAPKAQPAKPKSPEEQVEALQNELAEMVASGVMPVEEANSILVSVGAPPLQVATPEEAEADLASGQGVAMEGPAWTDTSREEVAAGIEEVFAAFPNAPSIKGITTDDDQTQYASASKTRITLHSRFHDDEFVAARAKDFGGTDPSDVGRMKVGTSRTDTIIHEYGHVLDSNLPEEKWKELRALLNEKVQGLSLWEVFSAKDPEHTPPSMYACEHAHEYVAEAVLDFIRFGDQARPISKKIGALMQEVYG